MRPAPGPAGASRVSMLVFFVAAGCLVFVSSLAAVQGLLSYAGPAPDSSVFAFCPIMAGLGAAFGFERWWSYELGPCNPFHEYAKTPSMFP